MNFNEFLEKEALSFKDTVTFDKDVLFQDENQTEHLLSLQKLMQLLQKISSKKQSVLDKLINKLKQILELRNVNLKEMFVLT